VRQRGRGGGVGLGFDPINKDEKQDDGEEEGLFKAKAVKEVDDRRRMRRTKETLSAVNVFWEVIRCRL
jgi:hypothetical protein